MGHCQAHAADKDSSAPQHHPGCVLQNQSHARGKGCFLEMCLTINSLRKTNDYEQCAYFTGAMTWIWIGSECPLKGACARSLVTMVIRKLMGAFKSWGLVESPWIIGDAPSKVFLMRHGLILMREILGKPEPVPT